jgi:hypothetical protein
MLCPCLRTWRALSGAALWLLLIAGCGGHGSRLVPTGPAASTGPGTPLPAQLPRLPAPSQVEPRRASTLIDVLSGGDYATPTCQNLGVQGTQGEFAPAWTAGSADPSGLAFGIYEFVPDVANDAPLLHLAWSAAPPAGSVWVGLADFVADRWVWSPWQAGHDLPLDLAGKNVDNQGRVRAVVLVAGSGGPYGLAHLRIGANHPPAVGLSVEHPNQPAPFTLTVHADGSADPDGVIVSYDFDFDNDGTFEQTGLALPQATADITSAGSFRCRVRVTDDDGAQAEGTVDWDTGYDRHWAAFSEYGSSIFYAVRALPGGGFYAAGSTITVSGGPTHALLVKFDADSNVVWARSLSSADEDYAHCLALAPDGGAYIAGSYGYHPGSDDAFLARYAPDGSLDWQRTWGGGKTAQDFALTADNGNGQVYLATTLNQDVTGYDIALLKFDSDGNWAWTRMWGALYPQETSGLALAPDGSLLLAGQYANSTDYDGLVLRFDGQGNLLAKLAYGQAGDYIVPGGTCVRSDGVVALFGTVESVSTQASAPYGLTLDSSLGERWTRQYDRVNDLFKDGFTSGAFDSGGKLWLAGYLIDPTSNFAGGLGWIADDGQTGQLWRAGPDSAGGGLQGLDIDADGSLLLAGYLNTAVSTGFTDTQRAAGSMSLSYFTPPENAYADNTAPLVSTATSAAVQPLAQADTGAVVYRYYPPLP